jgi:hypothetical protein
MRLLYIQPYLYGVWGFDKSGNILTTQILLSTCSCIFIDFREADMKVKHADVPLTWLLQRPHRKTASRHTFSL